MSYLRDLLEGPEDLKSLVVWVFTMPFWYVTIYVIDVDFYNKVDLFTLSCFVFCFTAVSAFIYTLIGFFLNSRVKSFWNLKNAIASAVIQISLLVLLNVISFIYNFNSSDEFTLWGFITTYFVGSFLLMSGLGMQEDKKSQKP